MRFSQEVKQTFRKCGYDKYYPYHILDLAFDKVYSNEKNSQKYYSFRNLYGKDIMHRNISMSCVMYTENTVVLYPITAAC